MQKEINCADLRELLWRGGGTLLRSSADGMIVRHGDDGAILTDYTDGALLCRVLDELELQAPTTFSVKSPAVAEALRAHYGLQGSTPCSQWVYCGKQPPALGEYDIRLLPLSDAPSAARHYSLLDGALAYLNERISARRLWGLYEDGALAAFAGLHTEGSMGLLEVLPAYRRRGYGYALEAFLIAWHLGRGYLPFGHVIDGNEASERLQRKLGMTRAELPAIWVFK